MNYRPSSLIPVSSSFFSGNESKYLLDCLSRNWITQGYYVRQFEEKFAAWAGRKRAIACSSGTATLHLALKSAGYGSGRGEQKDIAVIPAMIYIATANAAKYCGMDVYFTDVDVSTWCMNSSHADEAEDYHKLINGKLVVLPVDLFDSVSDVWDQPIVLDACHSYVSDSSEYAMATCISFYGSKLITTGEGGMVLTDDDDLVQQIKLYRGQGATIQGDYFHSVIGFNYRMTDLQAAVGLAQLEQIDSFIAYRRKLIDRYRENLRDDDRFTVQGGLRANGWMFALLLPFYCQESDRDKVRQDLLSSMIETRPFFRPIPSLPPYYESDYQAKYPVACELYRRGICLPTHVNLTLDNVDYICETLKEVVK